MALNVLKDSRNMSMILIGYSYRIIKTLRTTVCGNRIVYGDDLESCTGQPILSIRKTFLIHVSQYVKLRSTA